MKYSSYVEQFSTSLTTMLSNMAGIEADACDVKTEGYAFDIGSSPYNVAVPFNDGDEGIEGEFVLSIQDEESAIDLSNTIADRMGLPSSRSFDEMAREVLFEFWNTVVGRAITAWDAMGMSVQFETPFSKTGEASKMEDQSAGGEHYFLKVAYGGKELVVTVAFYEFVPNPLDGKKILIVDDSRVIRMMLSNLFKKEGCIVHEASDGSEAVKAFSKTRPDLTLMDLVMPELGGLEAIAKIRRVAPQAHIIVLTSTAKKAEVLEAAKHKVKGYIRKPVDQEKLLNLSKSCFA
jgi:CheY-like chemotaxis protein